MSNQGKYRLSHRQHAGPAAPSLDEGASSSCALTASVRWPLLIAVLSATLSSVGCWQEIRYEPDENAAPPPSHRLNKVAQRQEVSGNIREPVNHQPDDSRQGVPGQSPPSQPGSPPADKDISASALRPSEGNQPSVARPAPAVPIELPKERAPDELDDLLGESAPEEEAKVAPGVAALAAWQLGSNWSMAVALHAKGRGSDTYGEQLDQAVYGAKLLEIDPPPLPNLEPGKQSEKETIDFLLGEAGPAVAAHLQERHGSRCSSLTKLAVESHGLLLMYSPQSTRLESVIDNIRTAAQTSHLPEEVWRELVELLESRAPFSQVKQAVFQLHKRALQHLSAIALD